MPFEIGDLFFTTNNTNPRNRFGGTWELYAKGKTIVGIDPDDTDFNTIGKTGGSKYLQKHTHTTMYSSQTINVASGSAATVPKNWPTQDTGEAGTGNSGNLQPYIVSYIWIKTA